MNPGVVAYFSENLMPMAEIFENSFFGMASNNLGMLFSTNSYSETNPVPVNNFAQFNWPFVVEDTLDWKLISGSFIAD